MPKHGMSATQESLESAALVGSFSAVVTGATAPDGSSAVMLGMLPPDANGWTFPLSPREARRVAFLLVEAADAKEPRAPIYAPPEGMVECLHAALLEERGLLITALYALKPTHLEALVEAAQMIDSEGVEILDGAE